MNFASRLFSRSYSTKSHHYKVAVLGAAGGIGQPLSLLLKASSANAELISHLSLYDIANMGMSVDLAHIPTPIKVSGHSGKEQLAAALKDAHVVVIPAGVPRKPGMTRDDLFNTNASIVKDLTLACAQNCPNAHLLIISNPVNSTVPIAYEVLKKAGVSKPSVFGVTTLDVIRAKTFIGEAKGVDPRNVKINVIGGHSGPTIVPLFSTANPSVSLSESDMAALLKRIQYGGDEVVAAKNGGGSATLSMAYAANIFVERFLRALHGESGIIENTFVYHEQWKETRFLAGLVELGKNGLEAIHPFPSFNAYEKDLFEKAILELKKDIAKGIEFAHKSEHKI